MSASRRGFLKKLLVTASSIAVAGVGAAHAQSANYTYDPLGRLTRVVNADGSIVEYNYDAAGNRTSVVRSGGPPAPFIATIAVPSGGGVNLRTLADAAGYNGAKNATVTFQLTSNATVTGAAGAPGGGIAIDSGTWPTVNYTISLTLQVSGKVYGGGAAGGSGNGGVGGGGGDAIHCRLPMSITVNSGGEVKAGGGGGGAGGRGRINQSGEIFFYGGGGGGGGAPNGPGGTGGGGDNGNGATGSPGTVAGGGAGGANAGGGDGSAGGAFATAGLAGQSAFQAGGAGGAAGFAIRKNGNTVPVTNNGVITGTQG